MATRRFLPGFRPGWMTAALTFGITAVVASAGLMAPLPATAIHDDANTPFELDGDAQDNSTLDDWDSVFELSTPYPFPDRDTPVAGAGETFVIDSTDPDPTAFVQSNKDTDAISGWSWGTKGLSPPKDDITNAYAKAYAVQFPGNDVAGHPSTPHDHLIIYFGADRFADDGDSAMGFWFFRNTVGLGANGKFSGTHAVGDTLIQVDYRGTGSNEIEVFKWVGTGGNAGGGKLQRLALGSSNSAAGVICNAAGNGYPADKACITTNTVQKPSPWDYTAKSSDNVGSDIWPARVFQEGGFDVTTLVGNVCFSGFMAETRSSHTETASLKDFALGDFNVCGINVEKTCVADSQTVDSTDPANPIFTTTHKVQISNTGIGGSLYDVALADPSAVSGNACTITGIALDSGSATVDNTAVGFKFDVANESRTVATVLNGTITVDMDCTSGDNPFQNTASVKARSAPGAAQDVTDSDEESTTEAGVCEFDFDSGIAVRKWCQDDDGLATGHPMGPNPAFSTPDPENTLNLGVFLKPPSYVPTVCVDVEISNTSANQRMVIDSWSDDKLGNLLSQSGVPSPLVLNPLNTTGDSYIVSTCYTGIPDQAATPPTNPVDPTNATYTDTVNATAHGEIDNTNESAGPVSATCKLCPPHAD